jgi:hypothetical protein
LYRYSPVAAAKNAINTAAAEHAAANAAVLGGAVRVESP